MRRSLPLLLLAAAACVAPEPVLDARGAVAPGQRLVVAVYVAPGPWLVSDPDTKAESAAKLLPIGMLMQTMQEDRVLELSKELQPYLPRPRFDKAFEAAYLRELAALHDGKVQGWTDAELPPEARREFNRADDQLDWRRKYLHPRGGAPRDYSRFLSLDDALVVDVNLQFGTDVSEEAGRLLPTLTAATRVYRPGTTKLLWSRVDVASDQASTHTLTEFRAEPRALTDKLERLVPVLAKKAAAALAEGLRLSPPSAPAPAATPEPAMPPSITAAPSEPLAAPAQPAPAPEAAPQAAPAPPAAPAEPAPSAPPAPPPAGVDESSTTVPAP